MSGVPGTKVKFRFFGFQARWFERQEIQMLLLLTARLNTGAAPGTETRPEAKALGEHETRDRRA